MKPGEAVDAVTMVCHAHEIPGCQVCMIDDFFHWLDERAAKRDRIKQERKTLTVEDKYDLGGEG